MVHSRRISHVENDTFHGKRQKEAVRLDADRMLVKIRFLKPVTGVTEHQNTGNSIRAAHKVCFHVQNPGLMLVEYAQWTVYRLLGIKRALLGITNLVSCTLIV